MSTLRIRRIGIAVVLVTVAAIAVSASTAGAGTKRSADTWSYTTNPFYKFAFTAKPSDGFFPPPSACVAAFGFDCYTPSEIRSAYDFPAGATGAGQTIVIVDAYGSPTIQSDLQTFDAAMGLPDPTLNIIYPGGKPTFNPQQHHQETSWASETSLDVEWSHALAPQATIDLVIAANNGGDVLNNAQQYAISHHLGNVMSLSFGVPEGDLKGNNGNNGQQAQEHQNLVAAKAAGMTVFASAGDNGGDNGLGFVNASYPASDPLVTGVGGTNLFMTDTAQYVGEDVWNDADACPYGCTSGPFGATGGAPSFLYPGRTVADVAFNASVYTGVLVYMSWGGPSAAGFYFFGGTSEGSPSWAAITADIDQAAGHSVGQLNPSSFSSDLHDVTVGDNGFFGPGESAGPGYDMPTGWGSPDVAKLIATLG